VLVRAFSALTSRLLRSAHAASRPRELHEPRPENLRRSGVGGARRLRVDRQSVIPPDPAAEVRAVELQRARLRQHRGSLAARTGRYADGPIGHAVWEVRQAEMNVGRPERHLERSELSRKERRRSRAELVEARERYQVVERKLAAVTAPDTARIDEEDRRLDARLSDLRTQSIEHGAWIDRHPEAARRIDHLTTEIDVLDQRLERIRGMPDL